MGLWAAALQNPSLHRGALAGVYLTLASKIEPAAAIHPGVLEIRMPWCMELVGNTSHDYLCSKYNMQSGYVGLDFILESFHHIRPAVGDPYIYTIAIMYK